MASELVSVMPVPLDDMAGWGPRSAAAPFRVRSTAVAGVRGIDPCAGEPPHCSGLLREQTGSVKLMEPNQWTSKRYLHDPTNCRCMAFRGSFGYSFSLSMNILSK